MTITFIMLLQSRFTFNPGNLLIVRKILTIRKTLKIFNDFVVESLKFTNDT
jgi:hypothetical protein